jgi:transcription elongation factor
VKTRTPIRIAALIPVACAAALLAACGSSGGGTPATSGGSSQPASTTSGGSSTPASGGSSSGSGAKCTDLTSAAASAALGTTVMVTLDSNGASLPGLTVCQVADADLTNSIQVAVDTTGAAALFNSDLQSFGGTPLSGVGDKAFTDSIGVETLSGSVDIQVTGPAAPVLSGNFAMSTAIAKAMVAALS